MIRLDQEGNPFIPHQVAVLPVRLFNKESGTYPLRMIDNGSAFHAGNLKQIVDEPLKVQVLVIGNAEVFRPLLFTGSNHIIPQQLQIIIEHGQGRLKVMGNVADYFLKCCLGGFQLMVGMVQLGRALFNQLLQVGINPFRLIVGLDIAARQHDALAENQEHVGHDSWYKHIPFKYCFCQRPIKKIGYHTA